MSNADNITVKIEVKARDLVEACIKELTESGTLVEVVRCKDCKWFGDIIGCAINIVDESDMPKENDFCSFAERIDDE